MRFAFSGSSLALAVITCCSAGFAAGAITFTVGRGLISCGVHWGDVATWVSALATVAATVVALIIALWTPLSQRAAAANKSAELATTVAVTMTLTLSSMRSEVKRIPTLVDSIRDRVIDGGETSVATQLLLKGSERIPSGKDLDGLPAHFSAVLAALSGTLNAHNDLVQRFSSRHAVRADRVAFVEGVIRVAKSVERMIDKAEEASERYLRW
jgi:hypothetical protein